MGDAAGELDDLKPSHARSPGIAQHLAMLGCQNGGELVQVGLDQGLEAEQDASTLERRSLSPGGKGSRSRRDRRVDLGLARERDPSLDLAGGRVEDIAEA